MYGYGYGYGKKSIGYGSSISGWEKSHFGGFYRVVNDYPYISLSYQADIEADDTLCREFGKFTSEKLIKLYLLKAKELDVVSNLPSDVVKKTTWFSTKEYARISLMDEYVFSKIINNFSELGPLFEKYKDSIFNSYVLLEIKDSGKGKKPEDGEENENEEGQGSGSGEDGEENEEGQGSGSGEDGEENEEGQGSGSGEDGEENETQGSSQSDGKNQGQQNTIDKLREIINDISESKPFSYSKDIGSFDKEAKFFTYSQKYKMEDISPYRFTTEERNDAENLLKLLDISFDPKSEEVKNLKLGKLDVSKIAEVPAGNISIYKQTLEDQDTKPFSVCLLADMSGSMCSGTRIGSQFRIMNTLYLAMSQILPPDKLFIYGHSGEYSPVIYTFYSPYETEYDKNVSFYHSSSDEQWCQNYDGPVVEAIHKKIRGITDDRIIFITMSDGSPRGNNYGSDEDFTDLKRIIEKARRDSFVTVGIGLEASHVNELYTYSKEVNNLENLPVDVAEIINRVVRTEFK